MPEEKENKAGKKPNMNPMLKKEESIARLIRILQTDIPGNKKIYVGLTRIKGVSWAISNALCVLLKLDKNDKIESLDKEQISTIEDFLKQGKFLDFLSNRRNDLPTGENKHLIGSDLDLVKEFDIKRLKGIRSYRGLRHALGLPTRGQKTRSNFRRNRKKSVGVKSKKQTKDSK